MRIRSSLALLAFALTSFVLPATADSSVGSAPAAMLQASTSPEACIENAKGMQLAQIQTACCKAHKGICGCRAGKIVCCDNTTSKEPRCTCHGDEGVAE